MKNALLIIGEERSCKTMLSEQIIVNNSYLFFCCRHSDSLKNILKNNNLSKAPIVVFDDLNEKIDLELYINSMPQNFIITSRKLPTNTPKNITNVIDVKSRGSVEPHKYLGFISAKFNSNIQLFTDLLERNQKSLEI